MSTSTARFIAGRTRFGGSSAHRPRRTEWRGGALTAGSRWDAGLHVQGRRGFGTSTGTSVSCCGSYNSPSRQYHRWALSAGSGLVGSSRRWQGALVVSAVATTDGGRRKGHGASKVRGPASSDRAVELALSKSAGRGAQLQHVAAYLALELSAEGLLQVAEAVDHALSSVQAHATSLVLQTLARFDLDLETVGVDALLVLVQLAFSVWYIIGKAALQDGVDPLGFALLREAFSSVALWGMALKFEGAFSLQRPGDAQKFGVLGILCCLNVCGFLVGLSHVSELQASIMQPFVPVVVMAICGFMGIEALSNRSKAGVVLSTVGALGATLAACIGSSAASSPGGTEELMLGSLMLVGQVLAYSMLMIKQRELSSRYSPLTLTAGYYTIGSIMTAFLDLASQGFDTQHLMASVAPFGLPMDFKLWGAMIFAIIFPTIFCFTSMTYASSKVSPSTVSVYSALQPLFNLVLGLMLFHDEVSTAEVASGALIIGGLFLATDSGSTASEPAK